MVGPPIRPLMVSSLQATIGKTHGPLVDDNHIENRKSQPSLQEIQEDS